MLRSCALVVDAASSAVEGPSLRAPCARCPWPPDMPSAKKSKALGSPSLRLIVVADTKAIVQSAHGPHLPDAQHAHSPGSRSLSNDTKRSRPPPDHQNPAVLSKVSAWFKDLFSDHAASASIAAEDECDVCRVRTSQGEIEKLRADF